MKYTFTAFGHPNIRATHKTTLEFTRDIHLTAEGDCIVAVNADFSLPELKKFLAQERIKITVTADHTKETIIANPNPSFSDDKEIVIRHGTFTSPRTFATNADKAAHRLKRELIEKLKNTETKVTITIE